jgi:O-antigen/teichoic acid export membrane protein
MHSRLGRLNDLLLRHGIWRYVGALGIRGVEVLCKFGLYLLVAVKLGAAGAALFFLCMTWVNLLAVAARMGLDRAVARHVSAELALGRTDEARAALRRGLGWTVLGGLLASLATWAVAEPAANLLFGMPELAAPLRISALILFTQCLVFTLGGALIGLHRGGMAQLVTNALPPLLPLLALLLGMERLDHLLLLQALGYALCCALGALALAHGWRRRRVDAPGDAPGERLVSLWATARPLYVIDMIQICLVSWPVLLLGVFAEAIDVSRFSIASRLTMLITTILFSITQIAAAPYARHHARGEFAALRRVDRQARLLILLACLPVVALMLIFPGPLLGVMGEGFAEAALALQILALSQVVNILLPSQDMMLAMTGHGGVLRRLSTEQFVLSLLLGPPLVALLGLNGAALLSAFGLTLGRVRFALALRRVLPELYAR